MPFREYAVNSIINKKASKYILLIHLVDEKLYLIDVDTGKSIKDYPIISTETHNPDLIGTWKIISKSKYSGGFGTLWISLNVPWGKYSIHGTNNLNSIENSISHDCIIMFNKDIEDLYNYLDPNTLVVISSDFDEIFE
jgi:lipoprotein-anchoring transpeptidase ErfK/SrfK